jgi:hypothetical protein
MAMRAGMWTPAWKNLMSNEHGNTLPVDYLCPYELPAFRRRGINLKRERGLSRERAMFRTIRLACIVSFPAALLVAGPLQAGVKDVNVVNTPDVAVINSPDVNVANTPDVVVTNGASDPVSVKIENGTSEPIPVINAVTPSTYVREPFFFRTVRSGTGILSAYTVPSDRILVIESVNVTADQVDCSPGSPAVSAHVTGIGTPGATDLTGSDTNLIVVPLVQTSSCGTFGASMGASLTTRMYAPPNKALLVRNASGAGGSVITYTGYLLPSDSPSLAP